MRVRVRVRVSVRVSVRVKVRVRVRVRVSHRDVEEFLVRGRWCYSPHSLPLSTHTPPHTYGASTVTCI